MQPQQPNKVRTVTMEGIYSCRPFIQTRVDEALFRGQSQTRGISLLITDYVYGLLGRRRQRTDPPPNPSMSTTAIGGVKLDFFSETRRCEWNSRCGKHTVPIVFQFDYDGTCTKVYDGSSPSQPSNGGLLARPGSGIYVNLCHPTGARIPRVVCHNAALGRDDQRDIVLNDWPENGVRPFTNGSGMLYVLSRGNGLFPDTELLSWDTNQSEEVRSTWWRNFFVSLSTRHSPSTICTDRRSCLSTVENVISGGVFAEQEHFLDLHVDDRSFWVSTVQGPQMDDCRLYRFADSSTKIGCARKEWTLDWASRIHSWQRGCNVFAVSDMFQLFAVISGNSNDLVTIYDAETFKVVQTLRTGISDRFTTILKFRFIDLPDANGPILACLVERRTEEAQGQPRVYSYYLHTFLC